MSSRRSRRRTSSATGALGTVRGDLDLARARWRRSSYSGGANDCVEVADLGAVVAVRDSKDMEAGYVVIGRAAVGFLVAAAVNGVL
ncbi:DUF397 domain-containing protein [Streptomyces sp. NPDC050095]|uniref:DUF397 domain-containing protein n=1 Tax=unclassified Streptomyces TaxID=2593676 RepID=UPI0034405F67